MESQDDGDDDGFECYLTMPNEVWVAAMARKRKTVFHCFFAYIHSFPSSCFTCIVLVAQPPGRLFATVPTDEIKVPLVFDSICLHPVALSFLPFIRFHSYILQ